MKAYKILHEDGCSGIKSGRSRVRRREIGVAAIMIAVGDARLRREDRRREDRMKQRTRSSRRRVRMISRPCDRCRDYERMIDRIQQIVAPS
jgi:hypothetical protein